MLLQSFFDGRQRCPGQSSLTKGALVLTLVLLVTGTALGTDASTVPVDAQWIARLIADLDHDEFTVREKASAELEGLGKAAVPALRQTLAGQPTPEVRRRVEHLLAKQDGPPVIRQVATYNGYTGCGTYSGRTSLPTAARPVPCTACLGVRLEKPSDVVVVHLDLPKGQGLVVQQVQPDSSAAKAGVKALDILLEMNGKPVPSDPPAFDRLLGDLKPNTPVDAVVLRKGRKETVKGLSVPEARAQVP